MIDQWVTRFLRWSMIFMLIGLASGFGPVGHYMLHGDTRQCSWAPVHGHLLLLGWLGMTAFALTYRALGARNGDRLRERHIRRHFQLCVTGVLGVLIHGVVGAVVLSALGERLDTMTANRLWYGIDGLFLTVYAIGCLYFWAATRPALAVPPTGDAH